MNYKFYIALNLIGTIVVCFKANEDPTQRITLAILYIMWCVVLSIIYVIHETVHSDEDTDE